MFYPCLLVTQRMQVEKGNWPLSDIFCTLINYWQSTTDMCINVLNFIRDT